MEEKKNNTISRVLISMSGGRSEIHKKGLGIKNK